MLLTYDIQEATIITHLIEGRWTGKYNERNR